MTTLVKENVKFKRRVAALESKDQGDVRHDVLEKAV